METGLVYIDRYKRASVQIKILVWHQYQFFLFFELFDSVKQHLTGTQTPNDFGSIKMDRVHTK